MTERDQIENCTNAIKAMSGAFKSLSESASEMSNTVSHLADCVREYRLKNIPKESVEKYKNRILACAESAGYNLDEIADKLTDQMLRTNYLNGVTPVGVVALCLA